MKKLRPLVFEKWFNEGVNWEDSNTDLDTYYETEQSIPVSETIPDDLSSLDTEDPSKSNKMGHYYTHSMRGRPHRMPAFNTKYLTGVATFDGQPADGFYIGNGMDTGLPKNGQARMPLLPCIYTGVILVPPSKTTKLYYRMVVETVVQFYGVQTMDEITGFGPLNVREQFPVYWNDYREAAKDSDLKVEEDTITTTDTADIKKIMEA